MNRLEQMTYDLEMALERGAYNNEEHGAELANKLELLYEIEKNVAWAVDAYENSVPVATIRDDLTYMEEFYFNKFLTDVIGLDLTPTDEPIEVDFGAILVEMTKGIRTLPEGTDEKALGAELLKNYNESIGNGE